MLTTLLYTTCLCLSLGQNSLALARFRTTAPGKAFLYGSHSLAHQDQVAPPLNCFFRMGLGMTPAPHLQLKILEGEHEEIRIMIAALRLCQDPNADCDVPPVDLSTRDKLFATQLALLRWLLKCISKT
jgi:hypothetical protein